MQTARKNNKSFSATRHYCLLLSFSYLILGLFFFLPAQAQGFVEIPLMSSVSENGLEYQAISETPAGTLNGKSSVSPKILKVGIEGNRLISEAEILELIKSRSGNDFVRENIVADLEALYKTGYFVKSSIEALPVVVKDGVEINYFLKENPMVKDIYVYGNESETVTVDVYAILKDLLGRPQSVVVTSQKLREIEEKYATEGFVLARVVDVKWNEQEGILSVYVAEGELSDIVFEGNRKTKETYLRRLVARTKPGEPYNEKRFMKDFRRIKGTGYFKNVQREIEAVEGSEKYKLKVLLEENRNTKLGMGGGLNSGSGVFGNASVKVGNINGDGQNFDINATFGTGIGSNSSFNDTDFFRQGTQTRIAANYSIPYFMRSENTFKAYANYTQGNSFQVDFAEQLSYGAGLGLSRFYGAQDEHDLSTSTGFNVIDLKGIDDKKYIPNLVKNLIKEEGISRKNALKTARLIRQQQLISGSFWNFRGSYSYQELDSRINPRDGWKFNTTLEPVLGFSEVTSYTKLRANVSRYIPLVKESSLLVNARVGHELFGSIPRFDLYRLGGIGGVRGYRTLSQLGFGNTIALTTIEARTPIYNIVPPLKNIKIFRKVDFAVFTDAGLASGQVTFNKITERLSRACAVGFGVRVALPFVGRVRVDVGFPLVKALTQSRFFMFNFGPADMF